LVIIFDVFEAPSVTLLTLLTARIQAPDFCIQWARMYCLEVPFFVFSRVKAPKSTVISDFQNEQSL